MEKIFIVLAYLANTGIENALVEHEIYGHMTVGSVMSGSNYIRRKRHGCFSRNTATSPVKCFCFLITRCFE